MNYRWHRIAWAVAALSAPLLLCANPVDPAVMHGEAVFERQGDKVLQITVCDKAIIHWKDFSIDAGELTRFVQPSQDAAVLNRVMSGQPSSLMGALEANGKVYLINPNGILVGKDCQINTASFIASTLDVLSEDFLKNGELFFKGESKASIVNLGTINAWDGDVTLIGYYVDNRGKITAPKGAALLAAAREVLLKPQGQERIVIRPSLLGGSKEGNGIDNSGQIVALQAELKADGNPYALAIQHSGRIDALQVAHQGGRVLLVAPQGDVSVSGAIGAPGGYVQVLGERVALVDKGEIDVSADRGGGKIYVGGDSEGELFRAKQTYVAPGVSLRADALEEGDGGEIILWGDKAMSFYGFASVRGGRRRGDGGFVGLFGQQNLDFRGEADRLSPQGHAGTLLLDPSNITISSEGDNNVPSSSPFQPILPESVSNLSIKMLARALAGGDVIVQSDGGSGGDSGDVLLTEPFLYSSDYSLTLRSYVPGVVSGDVNIRGDLANEGSGAVIFDSARDINVFSPIKTGGGEGVLMTGGRHVNVLAPISVGGGITLTAGDEIDVNAPLLAQNGAISLSSKGEVDVNANIRGGAGGITLTSATDLNVRAVISVDASSGVTMISGGNVNIGDLANEQPSAISAPEGAVNIVATQGSVNLIGGQASGASAQITGGLLPINISAPSVGKGILLQGGSSDSTFARISSNNGSVSLWAGGDIELLAAISDCKESGSSISDQTGTLIISAGGNLVLQGGSSGNSAAITNQRGSINLTAANLDLAGGIGDGASAFIANSSNATTVNVKRLSLQGGEADRSFAEISSGSGTINVNASEKLSLEGGEGALSFAQIGATTGALTFNAIGGGLLLEGGKGTNAYAQIGQGLDPSGQSVNSPIVFHGLKGDLLVHGGSGEGSYAQIGHAPWGSDKGVDVNGAISFPVVGIEGGVELVGGTGAKSSAVIGYGNAMSSGLDQYVGRLALQAKGLLSSGNGIELQGGKGEESCAQIGFAKASNMRALEVRVVSSGDILVQASEQSPAHIGGAQKTAIETGVGRELSLVACSAQPASISASSSIGLKAEQLTVRGTAARIENGVGGDISFDGGSIYVEGGDIASARHLQLKFKGELELAAGAHLHAAADVLMNLASSGDAIKVDHSQLTALGGKIALGNLGVSGARSLSLSGDSVLSSSAGNIDLKVDGDIQVSRSSLCSKTGNIWLDVGGDLVVGDAARITTSSGQIGGLVGRDLLVQGGSDPGAYAQIGSDQNSSANISFAKVGGELAVFAGSGEGSYALIGHRDSTGAVSGNIFFPQVQGNIAARGNEHSSAQIGHHAQKTAGDLLVATPAGSILVENALVGHEAAEVHGSLTLRAEGMSEKGYSISVCDGGGVGFKAEKIESHAFQVDAAEGLLLVAEKGPVFVGVEKLSAEEQKAPLAIHTGAAGTLALQARGNCAAIQAAGALQVAAGQLNGDGSNTSIAASSDVYIQVNHLHMGGGEIYSDKNLQCDVVGNFDSTGSIRARQDLLLNSKHTGGNLTLSGTATSMEGRIGIGSSETPGFRNALLRDAKLQTTASGIEIRVSGDLTLQGDSHLMAQQGNIGVRTGHDLKLLAGDVNGTAAQISASCGSLHAQVGHNLSLQGGSGANAFARIGGQKGDIFASIEGDLLLEGGSGQGSYAQIGHLGSSVAGDIALAYVHGDAKVSGGSGAHAYAQIGHSGTSDSSVVQGDVSLTQVRGLLTVKGGSAVDTGVLIGHRRAERATGRITVHAEGASSAGNSIELRGGDLPQSAAVIGFDNIRVVHSPLLEVTASEGIGIKGGRESPARIGPAPDTSEATIDRLLIQTEAAGSLSLQAGEASDAVIASAHSLLTIDAGHLYFIGGGIGRGVARMMVNSPHALLHAHDLRAYGGVDLSAEGDLTFEISGNIDLNHIGEHCQVPLSIRSVGDLFINPRGSEGNITLAADTTLTSATGSISIGTKDIAGAKQIAVGHAHMQAPSQIIALQGDVILKTSGDLHVVGGQKEGAEASAVAGRTLQVEVGGNLTLAAGAGAGANAQFSSAFGDLSVYAEHNITLQGTGEAKALCQNLGGGRGDLTVLAGHDLWLGPRSFLENAGHGDLNAIAANDLTLYGNAYLHNEGDGNLIASAIWDLSLHDGAWICNDGRGAYLGISGRHTQLADASCIETRGGPVTMVVDHLFPTNLTMGDGRFIKALGAKILSHRGKVDIYTASQALNLVEGEINEASYIPGPPFVNTSQEQWLVWYGEQLDEVLRIFWGARFYKENSSPFQLATYRTPLNPWSAFPFLLIAHEGSHNPPFTLYYKDFGDQERARLFSSFEAGSIPVAVPNKYFVALSESMQEWAVYDDFLFIPIRFLMGYNRLAYEAQVSILPRLSSYDVVQDETHTILRRLYKNYNTKQLGQSDKEPSSPHSPF